MYEEDMCELIVILKDDERTYRKKYLIYEAITTSENDPQIQHCIEDAKKDFTGQTTDIQIKITITI
jgi:hypothetical protein